MRGKRRARSKQITLDSKAAATAAAAQSNWHRFLLNFAPHIARCSASPQHPLAIYFTQKISATSLFQMRIFLRVFFSCLFLCFAVLFCLIIEYSKGNSATLFHKRNSATSSIIVNRHEIFEKKSSNCKNLLFSLE